MPLPDWCSAYLHEAARSLLAAKGAGDQLKTAVSQALGFSRARGSNAVKDRAADRTAIRLALRYHKYCFEGTPSAEAYEKLAGEEGQDISRVPKLVKKGHDQLNHWPEPDERH